MTYLSGDTVQWASRHVARSEANDVFPPLFEYQAITRTGGDLLDELAATDIAEYQTATPRLALAPKHRYGFRQTTQLDPRDAIMYAGIVYELGADIQAAREGIRRDSVFSYLFEPDANGQLYVSDWQAFQAASGANCDQSSCSCVVTADIADFFPHLYHHRIENALGECTRLGDHVHAVRNMLGAWTARVSYGIPIGPSPSRLLAEIALDDVDNILLAEGVNYVRYVDDFRIFCGSRVEAYRFLSLLAETLFENHGLTLQQHKTAIWDVEHFRQVVLGGDAVQQLDAVAERFEEFASDLGLDNPYQHIEFEDLTDEQREELAGLGLQQLLREQLDADEPDLSSVRFLLRHMAQTEDASLVEELLNDPDRVYATFADVMRHIQGLENLDAPRKAAIGQRLLAMLVDEDCACTKLPFHAMWLLTAFAGDAEWNCEGDLVRIYNGCSGDHLSQREAVLALAQAGKSEWFAANRRSIGNMPVWVRRAFLYGASCLPEDQRRHWYRGMRDQLDGLERVVVDWAELDPLR